MTPEDLLTDLRMLNATVFVDGDQLRINAVKGVVTPELREALARHKPALMALLREGPAQDGPGRAPLSFAQQRMWMLDRMSGGSSAYNIAGALRMRGALDVEAIGRAIGEIVRRHAVLRTTFSEEEGEAVQVVHPAVPFELPVTDLSSLPPEECERRARSLRARKRDGPSTSSVARCCACACCAPRRTIT